MKNLITVVMLILLLALFTGCDHQKEKKGHTSDVTQFTAQELETGEMKMPSFELVSAQDGQTRNSSEYEGQVLFITFFESWCGACREEIDGLKRMQEKFRGRDFTVISLSVPQDDPQVLQKLAEKAKLNYPLLIGTNEILDKFGATTIVPVSFLVTRSGYVAKKYVGHFDPTMLEQDIEKLLPADKTNGRSP